jgi:hypothetical protein
LPKRGIVHKFSLALGFNKSTAKSDSRLKKIIIAEKKIVVPRIIV